MTCLDSNKCVLPGKCLVPIFHSSNYLLLKSPPAAMELACGCSLGQYLAIFATSGSISDLVDIRRKLRQRSRKRGATAYQAGLEQFRSQFMTRLRTSGKDLTDRYDIVHQKGLIDMAHEYLCVCENGSLYWPRTSDDGSLRYPRDQYE